MPDTNSFRLSVIAGLCLLSLLIAFKSLAADVRLATFPIPLLVENDSKGVFIDLLIAIEERGDLDIEVSVLPTKRALRMFAQNEVDGLFPTTALTFDIPHVRTGNIAIKRDIAFVRRPDSAPHSLAQLEGKTIGITAGYPYSKSLMNISGAEYATGISDLANMIKLSRGRIDVFIVEEFSGVQALIQSGADNITFDRGHPLSQTDVYVAFHNTEEGRKLAEAFNNALEELRKDGVFDVIMRPVEDMFKPKP